MNVKYKSGETIEIKTLDDVFSVLKEIKGVYLLTVSPDEQHTKLIYNGSIFYPTLEEFPLELGMNKEEVTEFLESLLTPFIFDRSKIVITEEKPKLEVRNVYEKSKKGEIDIMLNVLLESNFQETKKSLSKYFTKVGEIGNAKYYSNK